MARETWSSRIGFIMAAVGSAIGLGNIWRFPYMAYENGGGAFFIPYLFAMLTAGIPFIILEFGLGHRFRGAAPKTFASISKNWEWLGWWQVAVAFVISVYYVVVIGWAISYTGFALTQAWGTDPKAFFFTDYLQLSDSPMNLGSIQWGILATTILAWLVTWFAIHSGVRAGVERISKIFMPILFLLVLVLISRTVMLDGAMEGLQWLFKPDFSKIMDFKVWTAAYGQIFFSLSIGFAIMVTYSSYLPKDSDVVNNGFMTVFINCGFSMLAGILIFSILGYMAVQQGVGVNEVVSSGVGLAFITIPAAINLLPAPTFFGTLFFLALVVAGLSSMISITEAVASSLMDKFEWSRAKTAALLCGVGLVVSSAFASNGGLLLLDIVDHFINNFGILFCGLVEIVFISWLCHLDVMKNHVNGVSDFKVGNWWIICLRFVTPIVLGYMSIMNAIEDLGTNYGGYSTNAIMVFGWLVIAMTVFASFALQTKCAAGEYANQKNTIRRGK